MEPWFPVGVSGPLSPGSSQPLLPCFQQQIALSIIVERMLTTLFTLKVHASGLSRRSHLEALDLEFYRWQEALPVCAKWNKWDLSSSSLLPSVAALQ
ncbi:hypothetical protein GQ53DRAFT_750889 [Thozetella sp. PMI_491]|nr:hypothetical protein GQ53DRAFT_750889 [Thozetella sp. PMI_491]